MTDNKLPDTVIGMDLPNTPKIRDLLKSLGFKPPHTKAHNDCLEAAEMYPYIYFDNHLHYYADVNKGEMQLTEDQAETFLAVLCLAHIKNDRIEISIKNLHQLLIDSLGLVEGIDYEV